MPRSECKFLLLFLAATLAGCTNNRTVSSGDATSPDSNTCKRPAGSCLTDDDCGAGKKCDRPAETELDDPDCTFDPCQFAGGSVGNARQGLVAADQERRAPTLQICLGTCKAPACANNADCDDGWYCDFGSACQGPGICRVKPACDGDDDAEQRPAPDAAGLVPPPLPDGGSNSTNTVGPDTTLCGCDGKEYRNDCMAAAAGVSVAHMGPCDPGGCSKHTDCNPDQYCFRQGEGCPPFVGRLGSCKPIREPNSCPIMAHCPTVCGCNGSTYCSPCQAEIAGTNIADEGPCEIDPECVDVNCAVLDDCCGCVAAPDIDLPPSCPAMCDPSNTGCAILGITFPASYCLNGHCLLTESSSCNDDADCYMVNDCCNCAALPTHAKAEVCEKDCYVSKCTEFGIEDALARCINNRCELRRTTLSPMP